MDSINIDYGYDTRPAKSPFGQTPPLVMPAMPSYRPCTMAFGQEEPKNTISLLPPLVPPLLPARISSHTN